MFKFLRDQEIIGDTVCIIKSKDNTYFLNPSDEPDKVLDNYSEGCQFLKFQDGPIRENGVNGITEASLIKVLINRFETFQKERFYCPENDCILDNLVDILFKINKRTSNRINRKVEGKNEK